MPQLTRAPLAEKSIPQEIIGNDTRAQATENRRRITSHLDFLKATKTALPADPTQPSRLGTANVAREAGVSLGILRPGHPLRVKVTEMISELGLAIIYIPPARDCLTVEKYHTLFRVLAPAEAQKAGIKTEAMTGFVDKLFNLIRYRIQNSNASLVAPIIAELREESITGLLDQPSHIILIIKNFENWIAQSAEPGKSFTRETLSAIAFQDLLRLGMENTGLSQSQAAKIASVRQSSVHKWLHDQRSPNQRSYKGLRHLSEHFGFPKNALIDSITRSRGGDGFRFRLDDFPPEYRGKSAKRLRNAVGSRLTDDDFQLSTETFREHLKNICVDTQNAFKNDLARKQMRNANRIVQDLFSETLIAELLAYCHDLSDRGRSKTTQNSYSNHLRGFFSFALSSNAPVHIRLDPAQSSIIHAASRALWDAYFVHLTNIGRSYMGQDFRISRAVADRMTAVAALFREDGYIDRTETLFSSLETLSSDFSPKRKTTLWHTFSGDVKLEAIYQNLNKFRKIWVKDRSKPPVSGREEIADLLSRKDPMIAITKILSYLHQQKAGIRKWKINNGSRQLNHHYATILRKIVLIHLLSQTALRIGMIPLLTVGRPGDHLQWPVDKKPRLIIPSNLFKNGTSDVFKSGPYQRDLEDRENCYADLKEYLDFARPRLLDGSVNNHLFLSWSKKMGGQTVSHQVTGVEITNFTANAIGINAPAEQRLIRVNHLRPHHFRDILATSVLRKTNRNFALAGDAIHVTEETARLYYAYDTVEQRRPELQKIMANL